MLSVCAACNRTRHWFPAPAVRDAATKPKASDILARCQHLLNSLKHKTRRHSDLETSPGLPDWPTR